MTIDAKVYGVRLGSGVYGASDEQTSFMIGARHVSVADDTTHQVRVYFGNTLMRTMPTSMGKHEGEWVNGTYISFWTMDETYTVELDSTVDAQGHWDTSHGCLNLDHDNAEWFYEHSRVGDVVQIEHNGGPKITLQQGGDWSVPWSTWLTGSALHS